MLAQRVPFPLEAREHLLLVDGLDVAAAVAALAFLLGNVLRLPPARARGAQPAHPALERARARRACGKHAPHWLAIFRLVCSSSISMPILAPASVRLVLMMLLTTSICCSPATSIATRLRGAAHTAGQGWWHCRARRGRAGREAPHAGARHIWEGDVQVDAYSLAPRRVHVKVVDRRGRQVRTQLGYNEQEDEGAADQRHHST